eukprot:scaffold4425_cov204-Pinguiococcus_pyrenoidosus.AAC.2
MKERPVLTEVIAAKDSAGSGNGWNYGKRKHQQEAILTSVSDPHHTGSQRDEDKAGSHRDGKVEHQLIDKIGTTVEAACHEGQDLKIHDPEEEEEVQRIRRYANSVVHHSDQSKLEEMANGPESPPAAAPLKSRLLVFGCRGGGFGTSRALYHASNSPRSTVALTLGPFLCFAAYAASIHLFGRGWSWMSPQLFPFSWIRRIRALAHAEPSRYQANEADEAEAGDCEIALSAFALVAGETRRPFGQVAVLADSASEAGVAVGTASVASAVSAATSAFGGALEHVCGHRRLAVEAWCQLKRLKRYASGVANHGWDARFTGLFKLGCARHASFDELLQCHSVEKGALWTYRVCRGTQLAVGIGRAGSAAPPLHVVLKGPGRARGRCSHAFIGTRVS